LALTSTAPNGDELNSAAIKHPAVTPALARREAEFEEAHTLERAKRRKS
jgi:hypothetical protein